MLECLRKITTMRISKPKQSKTMT